VPLPNHTAIKRLTPPASCKCLDDSSYSENNHIHSNQECSHGKAAVCDDITIEDYAADPGGYVPDRKLTPCYRVFAPYVILSSNVVNLDFLEDNDNDFDGQGPLPGHISPLYNADYVQKTPSIGSNTGARSPIRYSNQLLAAGRRCKLLRMSL